MRNKEEKIPSIHFTLLMHAKIFQHSLSIHINVWKASFKSMSIKYLSTSIKYLRVEAKSCSARFYFFCIEGNLICFLGCSRIFGKGWTVNDFGIIFQIKKNIYKINQIWYNFLNQNHKVIPPIPPISNQHPSSGI